MDCNSWDETTACIKDIFSHGIEDHIHGHVNRSYLRVFPHFTEYKRNSLKTCGIGGKRGKITTFSGKARRRMLQLFGRIYDHPSVWQDFTFPDDVMDGRTIEQRAKYSSRCIKAFKRKVEREIPELWGILRREWERRKSGAIKGEECPHFHALYELAGVTEENYKKICIRLAEMWVDVIGTEERAKAFSVALHPKGYRWISSRKMAQNYVSKYVAKLEKHGKAESRGRYWMSLGDVPLEEPIELNITDAEADVIRRLFRKKVGDKRKGLYRLLRSRYFATWLFVEAVTVKLMLEYMREKLEGEEGLHCPF